MVIDALQKEDQYKDDHYVFYHGQPSTLGFEQRLFSWLVTKESDAIMPIIYPLPQTKDERIAEEKKLSDTGEVMYYGYGERVRSLYAVIDLFSNITLRLTVQNAAASSMPSITIEQVCRDAHREQVCAQFKNELNALKKEYDNLNQKGQLLQFRVKKDKLEKFVFPSPEGSNDVVTKDFLNLRSIVNAFQSDPEKIKHQGYSVGITISSALRDPNSGIKCSIINSVEPAEWAEYEKKEKVLRNKIEQYLNREQKTPAKSLMDYFR